MGDQCLTMTEDGVVLASIFSGGSTTKPQVVSDKVWEWGHRDWDRPMRTESIDLVRLVDDGPFLLLSLSHGCGRGRRTRSSRVCRHWLSRGIRGWEGSSWSSDSEDRGVGRVGSFGGVCHFGARVARIRIWLKLRTQRGRADGGEQGASKRGVREGGKELEGRREAGVAILYGISPEAGASTDTMN